MKLLVTGEKVQIPQSALASIIEVEVKLQSQLTIDIACFGLDGQQKLSDDQYMIFYNQTESPGKEICLKDNSNQQGTFLVDLSKIGSVIQSLVFTATIDGDGKMSELSSSYISFTSNGQPLFRYDFKGLDFQNEKAIIISEIYYKNMWRINAVGKGFNGGLEALLKNFGGETAEEQVTPNQTISLKKIELEKKLEKQAPKILNLAKKAKISLEKAGMQNHDARVALCLDISGSMYNLYKSGKMQEFAERILALGTRFDDDGAIDVFLFGKEAHHAEELTVTNFSGFVNRLTKKYPLEGGTYYGKVMKIIREYYFGEAASRKTPLPKSLPTYVMFVTDGSTFDAEATRCHIQDSSYEPIFWQFMAIGESKKDIKKRGIGGWLQSITSSDFAFLEELDQMQGRFLDNANFFSVVDPAQVTDEELYDLLLEEYPDWIKQAVQKGLILGGSSL
ncbi:MAG: VWA domain-containing protein [Sporomusaceae bacterium]|nr:VWA domain-containing protein [Sporomusaceae bacterium]